MRIMENIPDGNFSFKIVYLSPIAKAQRLYESQELQNAITFILPVAQIKTDMLDIYLIIDYFKIER